MNRLALIAALFAAVSFAQEEDDPFVDAKSIASCRKVYAAEREGLPSAGLRWLSTQFARCTRRVMNGELDRGLLPLKKSDAARFKAGMATQKAFNEAVQRYCGRWSTYYAQCCSTCSFNEQPECEADFHAARLGLLKDLSTLPQGTPRDAITREFTAFARLLCTQDDCVPKVLAALTTAQPDDGRALTCR